MLLLVTTTQLQITLRSFTYFSTFFDGIFLFIRRGSWRKSGPNKTPQIKVEVSPSHEEGEDGYVSDSSSTVTEDDLDTDENVLHPGDGEFIFSLMVQSIVLICLN